VAHRQGLLELLQPAFLAGFTLPDWIRLLRAHRWQIDAEYIPRALVATVGATLTSLVKLAEDRIRLDSPKVDVWRQPIFILGLGRSGTTYLFQLLARDPQFCFPTRFDCYNPHAFLVLRKLGLHRMMGMLPSTRRYMDDVANGWLSPAEDKVALCIMTSSGVRMQRVFPRTSDRSGETTDARWDIDVQHPGFEAAIERFARKLARLHGRRPLFKSPDHTTVIPQLLKVFPDARFITILRDPFSQYSSDAAMDRSKARQWSALQRPPEVPEAVRLEWIVAVLQRYVDTRRLIPDGNLVEIRYRELVTDPVRTLERMYMKLDISMPERFRVKEESGYRRNRHPELSAETKLRIREAYRPFVDAGLFDAADME
jgi:hypothetical protein